MKYGEPAIQMAQKTKKLEGRGHTNSKVISIPS
jgi:hypothetical protein